MWLDEHRGLLFVWKINQCLSVFRVMDVAVSKSKSRPTLSRRNINVMHAE